MTIFFYSRDRQLLIRAKNRFALIIAQTRFQMQYKQCQSVLLFTMADNDSRKKKSHGATRHCCYDICNSDNRYFDRDHMKDVFGFRSLNRSVIQRMHVLAVEISLSLESMLISHQDTLYTAKPLKNQGTRTVFTCSTVVANKTEFRLID